MNEDAFWLSLVSTGVFVSYLPHLYYSIRRYWEDRDYRSFRGAFVAVMLQIGLLRIVIGAAARASASTNTPFDTLQSVVAPILSLLLLTGGIVLMLTWIGEYRGLGRPK